MLSKTLGCLRPPKQKITFELCPCPDRLRHSWSMASLSLAGAMAQCCVGNRVDSKTNKPDVLVKKSELVASKWLLSRLHCRPSKRMQRSHRRHTARESCQRILRSH